MITDEQITSYCTDNTEPLTPELSEERQPAHRPTEHVLLAHSAFSKSRRPVSDWLKGICHPDGCQTWLRLKSLLWFGLLVLVCSAFSTGSFLLNPSHRGRVLDLKKEHRSGTILQTRCDLAGGMLLNVAQSRTVGWRRFSPREPLRSNVCVWVCACACVPGFKCTTFSLFTVCTFQLI